MVPLSVLGDDMYLMANGSVNGATVVTLVTIV
jgi:hypothetical protein